MFIFITQEYKKSLANLKFAYKRAIKQSAIVLGQKAKYLKK